MTTEMMRKFGSENTRDMNQLCKECGERYGRHLDTTCPKPISEKKEIQKDFTDMSTQEFYWTKQRKDKEWRKQFIKHSIFKNATSIEELHKQIAKFHKEYPTQIGRAHV